MHVFFSTSPIHLQHQVRMARDEALEGSIRWSATLQALLSDVEWSAMDATRTDLDYLCRAVEVAVRRRARRRSICPTRSATPCRTSACAMIAATSRSARRASRRSSSQCTTTTTSGMATANTIAAIEAGVRQVEVTINGHRRAGRQHRARRGRDGAADAPRQSSAATAPGSAPSGSAGAVAGQPLHRASPSRRTRRSSAPTPSRTSPASTRTA